MAGLFSLLFGGNKSEKDVKAIYPLGEKINTFSNNTNLYLIMNYVVKESIFVDGLKNT